MEEGLPGNQREVTRIGLVILAWATSLGAATAAAWASPRWCFAAVPRSYAELYEWLAPGQLLAEPPGSWAADWQAADPDRFTV
ncbi:hypothetical protein [Streptomyces sp. NPDC055709]